MKILVINLHSSRNAGDAVLLEVTIRQLQQNFPGAAITLAMNDPASYKGDYKAIGSFLYWLKDGSVWRWWFFPFLFLDAFLALFFYRWRGRPLFLFCRMGWGKLLNSYIDADLVVSCPGNFLYSSGRLGFPFLFTFLTMAYAVWAQKPFYMMPQSIGPLHRSWERNQVKWIIGRARLVFLRESISLVELKAIGADLSHSRLVPDLAFLYVGAEQRVGERLLRDYGIDPDINRPLIGVTLVNWAGMNRQFHRQPEYEQAVIDMLTYLIERKDFFVILFSQVQGPTQIEDDRLTAQRVYQQMQTNNDQIIFIDRSVAPEELRATYGLMDIFVGTRLHSNIFALGEGVPVVAIQYQYKTTGVMQMLDLGEWVIPIDKVDSENLTAIITSLWEHRREVSQLLKEKLPEIIDQASLVGQMMAADYFER